MKKKLKPVAMKPETRRCYVLVVNRTGEAVIGGKQFEPNWYFQTRAVARLNRGEGESVRLCVLTLTEAR